MPPGGRTELAHLQLAVRAVCAVARRAIVSHRDAVTRLKVGLLGR